MKHFIQAFTCFIIISSFTSGAQDKINIPNDPGIVTGRTPSGLTYYLVDRSSGNGLADFYLLRRGGSASEDSSHPGITSLLNSISLSETDCFPGGSLPSIIHHTGGALDKSLISLTEDDYSLQGIRNIPTGAVPSACDSALLVLLSFSGGADIQEENIDRDRLFHSNYDIAGHSENIRQDIRNEFLGICGAPAVPGTDRPDEISCTGLRDIYRGWSRPDLQAVIIIGDIDVNSLKNSLNVLSSTLPRARGPFRPEMVQVPVTPGTESFIFKTDMESDVATVSIHFLSTQLSREMRGTQALLVDEYLDSVLMELIRNRIKDALPRLSVPVYSFDVCCGSFMGLEQSDDMVCDIRTSPGSVSEVLSFLSGIIEGVREGVTAREYSDAAASHLLMISRHKNGMESTSDDYYLRGCIRHFLLGYTLPSWSDRSRYSARINSSFDWKQMNDYLAAFIDGDTHKIVTVTSPELLSESELKAAYMAGRHIPRVPPLDKVRNTTSQSPVPTSISLKKAAPEPITKSSSYSLPNGANVIFKKNSAQKGKLTFEAFSRGGISLAVKGFRTLDRYINPVAALSVPACSDTSSIELSRHFTGSMSFLEGRCDVKDVEEFFRMIRECFSPSPIKKDEFTSMMKALTLRDVHSYHCPDLRFGMMASEYLIPAEDRLTLSYEMAQEFINTCFNAAGDFTFLFCGDVPEDQIKMLIERYLSSLPGRTGKRRVPSPGAFHISRSDMVREASMEMESPRYYLGLRLTAYRKYDLPGSLKSEMIARIISQEVSEELFRSGVVVKSSDEVMTYPEECMSIDLRMVCPRQTDRYEEILSDVLKRLGTEGTSAERIRNVKNALSSSLSSAERSDCRFWIDILKARFINGKDFYTLQNKTVSSITEAEVNEELKKFISESRKITTRLSPDIIQIPKRDDIVIGD